MDEEKKTRLEEKHEIYGKPPAGKMDISEEDGVHEEWYKDVADLKTPEDLMVFMQNLDDNYHHDYGTICHAIAASGLGAMKVADHHWKQGGITGFQASCIMWEVLKHWLHEKGPLRLVRYEKMLYPQYADKFGLTISKHAWEWLQEHAEKRLGEDDSPVNENVKNHWASIIAGVVPFGYKVEED